MGAVGGGERDKWRVRKKRESNTATMAGGGAAHVVVDRMTKEDVYACVCVCV